MGTPNFVERQSVGLFILIVLGLSAAALLLPVEGEAAFAIIALALVLIPTIAASSLVVFEGGRRGLSRFLRSVINWRADLKWYLVALALAFVVQAGASILAFAMGRISDFELRPLSPVLIILILIGASLEETGWRGFALPRAVERQTPLVATLTIGVPWSLIHLVLILSGAEPDVSPIAEALAVLVLAFPLTWIYFRSGRIIPVAVVLHAAFNAFGAIGPAAPSDKALWFVVASGIVVIILLILFDYRFWTAGLAGNEPSLGSFTATQ